MGPTPVRKINALDGRCNDCRDGTGSWSARSHTQRARIPTLAGDCIQPISVRALTCAHNSKSRSSRGRRRYTRPSRKVRNFFRIKILTCNPYGLKILQIISAKPAPVKASRGGGGEGVPGFTAFSQNETHSKPQFLDARQTIFSRLFHNLTRENLSVPSATGLRMVA
jgi:hypothetical protein